MAKNKSRIGKIGGAKRVAAELTKLRRSVHRRMVGFIRKLELQKTKTIRKDGLNPTSKK